jgi:6-pyruvoyltetrahydropterin/6-carboxytetrahydropterin synthase
MTTIGRLFHWEMGHRLPFHGGGCANVHGHSYRMWLEVTGRCDGHGMLIDYGEMKRLVQPVIDALDHAFACDAADQVMRGFLETNGFKTVIVDVPTTAENLAVWLADAVWTRMAPFERIASVRVRLQETDNSFAEAGRARISSS